MKLLGTALALALIASASACTPEAPVQSASKMGEGPSEGTVLRRATLLTHDIEKSIAFYEMIGFEQWYIGKPGTISGEGLPVEGTKAGDPSRMVIMRGNHPYVAMIGLLQYGETTAAPAEPRVRHGDAIMMLEVEGLAEKFPRLVEAGYRVHHPLKTTHITSVTAEWDAYFAMVYDPDGHLVELTERLN